MELELENEKRANFCKILFDLSDEIEQETQYDNFISRLEELYRRDEENNYFRHYYSDIFIVLSQLHLDVDKGSIQTVGDNLSYIKESYQENKNADVKIKESINKLYDHISLEIARINYVDEIEYKATQEETIKKIKLDFKKQTEEINSAIKNVKNDAEELKNQMDNAQKDYISILGIFAAVVMSFVGGLVFSSSVLENIHYVSFYRLTFIVLLIGFVLSNILNALFYYIKSLTDRKTHWWAIGITNGVFIVLTGLNWLAYHFKWFG